MELSVIFLPYWGKHTTYLPLVGRYSSLCSIWKCSQIANWHRPRGKTTKTVWLVQIKLRRKVDRGFPFLHNPGCVCRHTRFTRVSSIPVYCLCDCARHAVRGSAGRGISGVRKGKLAQPFGRSPNWLGAADRMLTEHIAQTGTLFLPRFIFGVFARRFSSEEFPPTLLVFRA